MFQERAPTRDPPSLRSSSCPIDEEDMRQTICLIFYLAMIERIESMPSDISTKIDFESNEDGLAFEHSTLKATIDLNTDTGSSNSKTVSPINNKQSFLRTHNVRGFTRPNRPKERENHFQRDNGDSTPRMINNIKISVNGHEALPDGNRCENAVCNVSVTSKPDEHGNLVIDVHLQIITKSPTQVRTNDIPVIDGIRGTGSVRDEPSVYHHSVDRPKVPHSSLLHRNIPQIQVHRNAERDELWHRGRTSFLTPPQLQFNSYYNPRMYKTSPHYSPWSRGTVVQIDDKIDPSISKTSTDKDGNKE